eukprot:gene20848-22892_t
MDAQIYSYAEEFSFVELKKLLQRKAIVSSSVSVQKASLNKLVRLQWDDTSQCCHTQPATDANCCQHLWQLEAAFRRDDNNDKDNDNNDNNELVVIVNDTMTTAAAADNNNNDNNDEQAETEADTEEEEKNQPYSTHYFGETLSPSPPQARKSLHEMLAGDAVNIRVATQLVKSAQNVQQFFRAVEQLNDYFICVSRCVDFLIPPFVSLCEGVSHFQVVPVRTSTDYILKLQLFGLFSANLNPTELEPYEKQHTLRQYTTLAPLHVVCSFCGKPFGAVDGSTCDTYCNVCIIVSSFVYCIIVSHSRHKLDRNTTNDGSIIIKYGTTGKEDLSYWNKNPHLFKRAASNITPKLKPPGSLN